MLNDKWIGEKIVRLLGRDGSVFVQGAVNQDVETARILPWISQSSRAATKTNIEIEQEGAEGTERRTPLSRFPPVIIRSGRRQGMGIGPDGAQTRGGEQLEPRSGAEGAKREVKKMQSERCL